MAASQLNPPAADEHQPGLMKCEVTSQAALKKKGHFVLELRAASSQCFQIVTDRSVTIGDLVMVALTGTKLADGSLVKQSKIAGEWSQGALVDVEMMPVHDVPSVQAFMGDVVQDGEALASAGAHAPEQQEQSHSDSEGDEGIEICNESYTLFCVLPRADIGKDAPAVVQGNLHYVCGNAAIASFGKGKKVIAQVCNDHGRWGRGFAMAINDRWGKGPGKQYRQWHKAGVDAGFRLGATQMVELAPSLVLANMIGQSGTRTGSKGPPVRYEAMREALTAAAGYASAHGASVHMPRIATGLAGGTWSPVEEIITSILRQHSIDLYVYDYTK